MPNNIYEKNFRIKKYLSILAIIYIFDNNKGTRMSIYYWQSGLSAAKGDKLIVNQLDYCKTNDKGIDKFTSKSDVILSFNDCMQSASRIIPARRKFRTYIGLAATAGMRLLK